jgi:hypothetical protein
MKRRVKVDLDQLSAAFELNFPESHYYLDLETGRVVMTDDEPYSDYRDMERFITAVEDPRLREQLWDAIRAGIRCVDSGTCWPAALGGGFALA